jgi:hypothetical protein
MGIYAGSALLALVLKLCISCINSKLQLLIAHQNYVMFKFIYVFAHRTSSALDITD